MKIQINYANQLISILYSQMIKANDQVSQDNLFNHLHILTGKAEQGRAG